MLLKDKIAVITGGAGANGLGYAAARQMAAQGARVQEVREHRNKIAHQLALLLVDPSHEIDLTLLEDMAAIIRAVGAFFGRIAMDCDPEFDGRDVKDEDIRSGTSLLMDHLIAACEAIPN